MTLRIYDTRAKHKLDWAPLNAGQIVARQRFRPNTFVEEGNLPAVRAPQEREFCLTRLASIAAAA